MKYFDLHCDTASKCYRQHLSLESKLLAVNTAKKDLFSVWKQCFAIWIRDDEPDPFGLYCRVRDSFSEIRRNLSVPVPVMTVEGGAVIEDRPERLTQLKKDGIRALTLTWNGENRIAGGTYSPGELTAYGKKVIREMNRLAIACDVSHLNDQSFDSVIEEADFVLATHSDCRAVCDHPRNLTDSQLRRIAEKNGVIGLCFYPVFLGGNVYEKMYENICHLADMGLENHIAVGSDFDGGEMDPMLASVHAVPQLYRYLYGRGLDEKLLERVFYGNAAAFFHALPD